MKHKIILLTTFVIFQAFAWSYAEVDTVKETAVKKIAVKETFERSNEVLLERVYLEKGDQSSQVVELQQLLTSTGDFRYPRKTGYFGPVTESAVKKYQKRNKILADGIVRTDMMKQLRNVTNIGLGLGNRGTQTVRYGKPLNWWKEVRGFILNRGDIIEVEDFRTGTKFNVMVTYGTNHADVEALTTEDTEIMKNIWGSFSWGRRPALIEMNGDIVAASMTFMPHAGLDNKPEGKTIANRSAGFGSGYNFDKVKQNGMDGHVDIHFYNSTRHKDGKEDYKHQDAVLEASGLK